ncbi:hypothetical protein PAPPERLAPAPP_02620 [Brevundimonas phage vB_BpoS-Papperlapapp]|uniref:Uncharacterized protein n=2 Tax=Marchewkavirus TaxID=3425052 RepID=A0A9E7MP22_9CAUD|nr:hypothetical protein KABACHOK_00990 [Brevundimonas phage vB_BpoS-Kabachok]USN14632.1 hypothetical protein DOMOVOI_01580 [Brevundimonas phage vB_BpoS-Domovoi]USN16003.1 hypothetical protein PAPPERLAPAPP_02620 [Brevundimonas phage vB_BpoS-Papperlapapp]
MPTFDKSTWTEGQAVIIAYPGRRGIETSEAKVVKIGRAWLTVQSATWSQDRYDFSGRQDSDFGHRAQLWPSRDAFDAEQGRKAAWRRLRKLADDMDPPSHLTTAEIESLSAILDAPA